MIFCIEYILQIAIDFASDLFTLFSSNLMVIWIFQVKISEW